MSIKRFNDLRNNTNTRLVSKFGTENEIENPVNNIEIYNEKFSSNFNPFEDNLTVISNQTRKQNAPLDLILTIGKDYCSLLLDSFRACSNLNLLAKLIT